VEEKDTLIPVGETPFAADNTFGFKSSNLKDWVEEKTEGRIKAEEVQSISLDQIRLNGPDKVKGHFEKLEDHVCIVNAVDEKDLGVVAVALLEAEKAGKKFTFRTAASIVPLLAGMKAIPLLTAENMMHKGNSGGLFIVGSYVPKSSQQLTNLLKNSQIESVEIPVKKLLNESEPQKIISEIALRSDELIQSQKDMVLYTSREVERGDNASQSLEIINRVSQWVVDVVQKLKSQPRYVLVKGGITSSDIATKAFGIKRALVLGQILPGVPVWKIHHKNQELAYIVFPGNVGDENALRRICNTLKHHI
jgi:uncharacterized protein YgbK (DUF1537 family)